MAKEAKALVDSFREIVRQAKVTRLRPSRSWRSEAATQPAVHAEPGEKSAVSK